MLKTLSAAGNYGKMAGGNRLKFNESSALSLCFDY